MATGTNPLPGCALGRNDRHVRRAFVHAEAHTSRHRLHFYLEEALRLTTLPGESEGRVYHFRRLSLLGVPAATPRTVWIERLQQVLLAQARIAVHAADPRSHSSDAVFFHHEDEAFEIILRSSCAADCMPAWFWQPAIGLDPAAPRTHRITAIVEQLRNRRTPQATAAIILTALHRQDPSSLLSALPNFIARNWLRVLEISGFAPLETRAAFLPDDLRASLISAAESIGWHDDRTIWLGTQIFLTLAPPSQSPADSVKKARATLQHLASLRPQSQAQSAPLAATTPSFISLPHHLTFNDDPDRIAAPSTALSTVSSTPSELSDSAAALYRTELRQGDHTPSAGLYFLLQALRHIGMADALTACPVLAEAGFIAHLLRALALDSGVAAEDAILCAISPQLAAHPTFDLSTETLAALHATPAVFPHGFGALSQLFTAARFLRLWKLAVRRWCWRMASITTREIIGRPGRIWLTRSDLDVTLALSIADIRIRRLGLDIDPGWVPWLGRFGLVVRFHYHDRGEDAC